MSYSLTEYVAGSVAAAAAVLLVDHWNARSLGETSLYDKAAPKVAQGAAYLRDEATIRAAQFKARFAKGTQA